MTDDIEEEEQEEDLGFFDKSEISFLIGIKEDHRWQSILHKIKTFGITPRFTRVTHANELSVSAQKENWIYQSGKLDGYDQLYLILSLNQTGEIKDGNDRG